MTTSSFPLPTPPVFTDWPDETYADWFPLAVQDLHHDQIRLMGRARHLLGKSSRTWAEVDKAHGYLQEAAALGRAFGAEQQARQLIEHLYLDPAIGYEWARAAQVIYGD